MRDVLLQRAIKLNREHKRKKGWQKVVSAMMAVVVFCTTYALILPAITMEREAVCGLEAHEHADACYTQQSVQVLGCDFQGQTVVHTHDALCLDAQGTLICRLEETGEHTHGQDCWLAAGTVICGQEECEAHAHSEDCLRLESVQVCALEETEGHVHGEACWQTQRELTCQEHTHEDGCYTETSIQVCQEAESEAHTHGDACHQLQRELTCQEHTHDDTCFTEVQVWICQEEEREGHAHDASCFELQEVSCQIPETEGHVHSEACFQAEDLLICEMAEISLHAHEDACYDTDGNLICERAQVTAHQHTEQCLVESGETVQVLTCTVPEHIHSDACYPVEETTENTVNGYLCGSGAHIHGEGCLDAEGNQTCNIPEHTHEAACVVANLDLTADVEQAYQWEADLNALAFTGDWAADTLLVAQSQLGYQESEKNCILVGETLKGYSRYGAWYGEPYGDWNAMFIAFCLHYAGVEDLSLTGDCGDWIAALETAGLYRTAGAYIPEPGDLVFFDWSQRGDFTGEDAPAADHVGLVQERDPQTGEIKVIEGDSDGRVACVTYQADDAAIIGYAQLPEKTYGCGLEAHVHQDGCYDENGSAVCGLSEHSHEAACTQAEALPLSCTAVEHTHSEACFSDEIETPLCGLDEHTHGGDCYGTVTMTFTYEDSVASMVVTVVSPTRIPEGTRMVVTLLMEGNQNYTSFEEYVMENGSGELFSLMGYRISFFSAGQELALEDAEITAEVTVKPVEEPAVAAYSFEPGVTLMSALNELQQTEDDTQSETDLTAESETDLTDEGEIARSVTATVLQKQEDTVTESGNADLTEDGSTATFTLKLGIERTLAVALTSEALPSFQVQYYCHLPHFVFDYTGKNSNYDAVLSIIDTSSNGDGTGGSLPSSGSSTNPNTEKGVMYLYLEEWGVSSQNLEGTTTSYHVATQYIETEIYSADSRVYSSGLSVQDLNKIRINSHYAMDAVWVSQDGGSTWTTYGTEVEITDDYDVHVDDISKITFTNNAEVAGGSVILIQEGTIIRFEYTALTGYYSNSVNFFDYDISNGTLQDGPGNSYSTYNQADAATTGPVYMNTYMRGINLSSNYLGSGAKFAFGNDNTATGLAAHQLNGNNINKYNSASRNGINSFSGCSFGLVTGYDLENDRLIYASGIAHLALFNDESYYGTTMNGKTTYSGSTLDFVRVGDTYVLQSVNNGVENADGIAEKYLDEFFTPSEGLQSTSGSTIFTNNFWPMDGTVDDDTSGHDMLFGEYSSYKSGARKYTNGSGSVGNLPLSDDHNYHNCYFGMQYAIEFTLDGHYTGPLEYLFYGDDDMWVFLTYPDGSSVKICDIGGVHSSVGSYTNLWDYIKKGEESAGTYTLTFFYTERGASGSSCYMAFTIPHVVSIPQNTNEYGSLSVTKQAEGESQTDATYSFQLDLSGKGDTDLFPYMISGPNTQRTGSISSGDTLTIAAGETFTVYNIPAGVEYTLTELFSESLEGAYEVAWENGTDGSTVYGTIISDKVSGGKTENIVCTNTAVGDLEIEKVVNGPATEEIFVFDITLQTADGENVSGTFGNVTFVDGKAQVELTSGTSVKLTGIPTGYLWTVTEQAAGDYKITYQVDGAEVDTASGTIEHNTSATVTVVNTALYSLPLTGGMGSEGYAFSGLLILAAGLAYISLRGRRNRREADG